MSRIPPIEPARNIAAIWASWCGEDNRWYRAMMAFDAVGGLSRYWCGMPRCASAIPLTFSLHAPDSELACNYRLKDIIAATNILKSRQTGASNG